MSSEIPQNSNYNNMHVNGTLSHKINVTKLVGAITLDINHSGHVFTIDQDATFDITLPTAATAGSGWHAKFILIDAGSGTVKIIPNSAEDTLIGIITSADGSAGASAESGVDELIFVASTATLGDHVELICDGSNFYVSGQMHDANHITLA